MGDLRLEIADDKFGELRGPLAPDDIFGLLRLLLLLLPSPFAPLKVANNFGLFMACFGLLGARSGDCAAAAGRAEEEGGGSKDMKD